MRKNKGIQQPSVIFLPGGIEPAAISYGSLLEIIKDEVHILLKDLEVYAMETTMLPSDYTLEVEIEGIKRIALTAHLKSFHLVGFSGGGSVSLCFAARYPESVKSLTLIEPAWIGNQDWSLEDIDYWREIDQIMALPFYERIYAFQRYQVRPGVKLPSHTTQIPSWLTKRPVGIQMMHRAFKAYHLDKERLRCFLQPVYIAYGSLSNSIEERKADTLSHLLPNACVEVYDGLHHLNPPHHAEAERFAEALRHLWVQDELNCTKGYPKAIC